MQATRTQLRDAYYARIVPVVGEGLLDRRIAVCGVAAVAGAVERLAGCRALQWEIADDAPLGPAHPLVRGAGAPPGVPAGAALAASLRVHNTWEDGWAIRLYPALTPATAPAVLAAWRADPPDLLLGGGSAPALARIAGLARALDRPAVLVLQFAGADPAAACLALLPGDGDRGRELADLLGALGHPALCDPADLPAAAAAWHAWSAANGLAALLGRALLRHGTAGAAPDLDRLLWHERRTAVVLGAPGWPWAIHYANLAVAGPRPNAKCGMRNAEDGMPSTPQLARRSQHAAASTQRAALHTPHSVFRIPHSVFRIPHSALVVGCGSLGSLAARALAASGAVGGLVVLDGERVEAANPVRQWFHTAQVGRPKAEALAENLAPWLAARAVVCTVEDTVAGEAAFRRVVEAARPAVVLLTTGTAIDYTLARLLRARDIPHVVGRCYPRARYFEAIVVDGRRGPCFGCLRGHLYTGPAPRPTPEEALRYGRAAESGALAAEPATVVESGCAADALALLTGALAAPRAARPAWLAALLAAGQTCLIGANSVEQQTGAAGEAPGWAYGIPLPGQVVAFGLAQVLGAGAAAVCADCGRRLPVRHAT